LALIFLLLGIDEIACIHEKFTTLTKALIPTEGLFHFAWVIPYGIFVLVLAASYLKFFFRLPNEIRTLFILSGVTFVSGAIGFEMLGSREAYIAGGENLVYAVYYTIEELFEMLGSALFIYAILKYMVVVRGYLSITIKELPRD
jgi:hypothetical protein